ncbi:ANTH-domain-containing protein [Coniophora puteana RWD-64-598 SS2]|uniref:ANTH-domain-containing protein n=1 Tax=Coniophora puteana (strain RWD-64-598) TaxID=741705 RepID=A0A5M3MIQ1_CONPW|nr:ANTH-domain-containing protein [Coniophora puteana RWD-64-598 SS2]EIW79092.1 ANTH-domain-containing protein [Coniophora puteana RWD-64-598 SS2]
MSSFDKIVKLACKPKAAPPKAKYLDPIIAATWSEEGAVHDVCKALVPRLREPNAIIAFKALLVLHTMIRNGSTDNVLSYLCSSEVLRLRNVSTGNWDGYAAPQNMQNYALYLDTRIRAYRELKHDAIRVQAESNRDMRLNNSLEEDGAHSGGSKSSLAKARAEPKTPQRSKTMVGRKLRIMTVEKGLLRETKIVQKMIDALIECKFYSDDLEDELTIFALQMLVKDLLILFQAGNEGVINVLEHYFEMSKVDAKDALQIYRQFCNQAERVVEFLGVAKKLQNLLHVPIPNLKHAPVSLAGALEEYLNDPNFEQNRIEYKANREAAEKNGKAGKTGLTPKPQESATSTSSAPAEPGPSSDVPPVPKVETNNAVVDFFNSIDEQQPTMFNPNTGSPTMNYFQQQAAHNPFVARQMTGAPFPPQQTGAPFIPQQTGFAPQVMHQATGFPGGQPFQQSQFNAFSTPQLRPQAADQPQHRPFSSFVPSQPTGFQGTPQMGGQGPLVPQTTGGNPFRQTVLMPQMTGMAAFNTGAPGGMPSFPSQPQQPPAFSVTGNQPFGQPQPMGQNQSAFTGGMSNGAFGQPNGARTDVPTRPGSAPLTSMSSAQPSGMSPPMAQPVKTHTTGSRNPFGVPIEPPPPMPKPPTLLELSMGAGNTSNSSSQSTNASSPPPQLPQQTGGTFGGSFGSSFGNSFGQPQQPQPTGALNSLNGAFQSSNTAGGSTMSNVASSFAKKPEENKNDLASLSAFGSPFPGAQSNATGTTNSTFSDSLFSSSLGPQPTGSTFTSSAPSISVSSPGGANGALKPQTTGFAPLKAFKPSSSFGASLLESLPPIPQSAPTTPDVTGKPAESSPSPAPGSASGPGSFAGGLGTQPTGFASGSDFSKTMLGTGLRPQMTGGPNPFRATMFATSPSTGTGAGASTGAFGANGTTSLGLPSMSGFGGGSQPQFPSMTGFGAGSFGQQQQSQQQSQQQQNGSLI